METKGVCPYIDQTDERCAIHLSLNRLDDALGVCADCYESCHIYQKKLLGDVPKQLKPAERLVG